MMSQDTDYHCKQRFKTKKTWGLTDQNTVVHAVASVRERRTQSIIVKNVRLECADIAMYNPHKSAIGAQFGPQRPRKIPEMQCNLFPKLHRQDRCSRTAQTIYRPQRQEIYHFNQRCQRSRRTRAV